MTLAVLASCAFAAAAPAAAQRRQKRELARIQSELRKAQTELADLRASEDALGRDVGRLENLDAESRRRVELLRDNILRTEKRTAELKSRLDSAGRVSGFWAAALSAETARRAAVAAARADFYGTGELWAEEFRRAAILEKGRHLRSLTGFQRRTEKDEADARRRAEGLARSRRLAEAEREEQLRQYQAKKTQLELAQARVAEAARRARELEDSEKAMTVLIERIARSHRPAGAKAVLDRPRHSLPWPAEGEVVSGFGREKDEELGTWTVRQGLMIGTAPSAPVTAVASGRVIFAGLFRSYGRVLILDHDGGFFSVYGNLGDILKEKGAGADAGEMIARAGGGPRGRVYLEFRRGTEALDPLAWLEKKNEK